MCDVEAAGGRDGVPLNSQVVRGAVNQAKGAGKQTSNIGKEAAKNLTRKEARDLAKDVGYTKEVKDPPFNSHGQPAFQKGNRIITPDVDGHRGGTWKLYDLKGNRLGTYNENLTIRVGP